MKYNLVVVRRLGFHSANLLKRYILLRIGAMIEGEEKPCVLNASIVPNKAGGVAAGVQRGV